MATLARTKQKITVYHLVFCIALSVALLRPLVENLRYPLLTGWDTWNFLGLSKLITDNGGTVPNWDTLQLQPGGRPYLYPPLVPFVLANVSRVTGISLFWLIKIASVILYPILATALFVVASQLFNRKVALVSLVYFLSLNQAYINSINSLSQVTEMLLYLAITLALFKRRYLIAGICFGLAFWTHSITPLFFGIGLFLYGLARRDERQAVIWVLAIGCLIGAPWLLHQAANADWIRPNTLMHQHTRIYTWLWTVVIEGFPFFILTTSLITILLMDRTLLRSLYKDRAALLLACTTTGLAIILYYPERATTYLAPAITILLATVAFQTSEIVLRRALLFVFLPLSIAVVFAWQAFGWLATASPSIPVVLIALIGLAILAVWWLRAGRRVALIVLGVILFVEMNPNGFLLPFVSWASPAQLGPSMMVPEAWDACRWLAAADPTALVGVGDARATNACNYFGLRTTTASIMEFSRDGNVMSFENADYYLVISQDRNPLPGGSIWRAGEVAVYPARVGDPRVYSRVYSVEPYSTPTPSPSPAPSPSPTPPEEVDLTVTTFSPNPVLVFAYLKYKVVIQNNGPETATDVVVRDTLPGTVDLYSTTSSQGSCSGTTQITCFLGQLDANSSATVDILVTPKVSGDIPNIVIVDANETDPISVAFHTTVTCSSPPGGHYLVEPTNIVDSHPICDSNHISKWSDEAENQFEMWCTLGPEGLEYQLWYTNEPDPLGKCIWFGGRNTGQIMYPGNTDADEEVNCFLSSFWMSIEPNYLKKSEDCSAGCQGFGCQGFCNIIDFKTWAFDVQSGLKVERCWVSLDGPGGMEPDVFVECGQGISFDSDRRSLSDDLPMIAYEFELCDNDKDGDCDQDDMEQFRAVIGQCEDGDNFNLLADANHDGCATTVDFYQLFPGKILFLPSVLK